MRLFRVGGFGAAVLGVVVAGAVACQSEDGNPADGPSNDAGVNDASQSGDAGDASEDGSTNDGSMNDGSSNDGSMNDGGMDAGPPTLAQQVEQLAHPVAFASISQTGGGAGLPLAVTGSFTLGAASDGIDPSQDRVVLFLGDESLILEPGSFSCSSSVCGWSDPNETHINAVTLTDAGSSWSYQVTGGTIPSDPTLTLRIGNDWGGINLVDNSTRLALTPKLEAAKAVQATIGAAGGTVRAVDSHEIAYTLNIPAGALAADTQITVTPLESSPLTGGDPTFVPGVSLEPDGLQLSKSATLTIDLQYSGLDLSGGATPFLVTSPVTQFPLTGHTSAAHNTVVAAIDHFSVYTTAAGDIGLSDLTAWADPILNATPGNVDLTAIGILADLYQEQQTTGCSQNCISAASITNLIDNAAAQLVTQACPLDIGDPSLARLMRWLALEALAQQVNASVPSIRQCAQQVLAAMISREGMRGRTDRNTDSHALELAHLYTLAQELGFSAEETLARQELEAVMTAIVAWDKNLAQQAPSYASLDRLERYLEWAQRLSFAAVEAAARAALAPGIRVLLNAGRNLCNTDPSQAYPMLYAALGYASRNSVDTVDSNILSDIGNAITACSPGDMLVTVTFGSFVADAVTQGATMVGRWYVFPNDGCGASGAALGCFPIFPISSNCVGTAALPVTLDTAAGDYELRYAAGSRRVVEWELNRVPYPVMGVAGNSLDSDIRGTITLDRPGTLELEANTKYGWKSCHTFQPLDEDGNPLPPYTNCGIFVVNISVGPTNLSYHPYPAYLQPTSTTQSNPTSSGMLAAGTYNFSLGFGSVGPSNRDGYKSQSGVVARLKFTPATP